MSKLLNGACLLLILSCVVYGQLEDDIYKLNPKQCGRKPQKYTSIAASQPDIERRRRFLESEESNNKDWPWQAALATELGLYLGTLINSQWILTSVYVTREFAQI
jgi:hypothetical protein